MKKYILIKNNIEIFQIYRVRSIFILFLFFMCIDIKYESIYSLIIPLFSCLIYITDCYIEHKSTKIFKFIKSKLKLFKFIFSMFFISYMNILVMQEVVKVTGFSYNNFSLSLYVLFITTLVIFSVPLSLLFILVISIFYELKLLMYPFKKINNIKNVMKIIHSFIMFLIPIFFFVGIYNKTSELIFSEMGKLFQRILVYSSYTDLPERCNNKSDLEKKYTNIQVAFVDYERMSIAYLLDGDLFFSSELCKDN